MIILSLTTLNRLENERHLVPCLKFWFDKGSLDNCWLLDDIIRRNSQPKFKGPDESEQQSLCSGITEFRMLEKRQKTRKTYSTREKRYPIQAWGPPRKVIMLPHTPGIVAAASGICSHRSGLRKEKVISDQDIPRERSESYLNSKASSPHIDFNLFKARIGIRTVWPFSTLWASQKRC